MAPVLIGVVMIKRTTKPKNESTRATFVKGAETKPEPAKVEAAKSSPAKAQSEAMARPNVVKPIEPKAQLKLVKPEAKSVCVAGSFNEWNPARTPLTRVSDGTWIGELNGVSGRHEYLFVVDGQWLPDPNAKESVQNPFGGKNSVLVISQ
jgi:1,4-alpha-glucan branching enzyme